MAEKGDKGDERGGLERRRGGGEGGGVRRSHLREGVVRRGGVHPRLRASHDEEVLKEGLRYKVRGRW